MPPEIVTNTGEEENEPKSTVGRVSKKYGIPPEEVEALLGGRPVRTSEPHPLTMGALMENANKAKNAMNENERNSWSPVAVLGAILGIAGIMSLIVLLVFLTRWGHHPMPKMALRDTIIMQAPPPPMPPPPRPDTAMTSAPSQAEPQALPEAEKKPASVTHTSVRKPYLSTTSSIEAEERLAELRAEGNRKAKIVRRTHAGITFFDVR